MRRGHGYSFGRPRGGSNAGLRRMGFARRGSPDTLDRHDVEAAVTKGVAILQAAAALGVIALSFVGERPAYWFWTLAQGPVAALSLVALLGGSRVTARVGHVLLSSALLILSWLVLGASTVFTPVSMRLVGLWTPSPWSVVGLLPALTLTSLVSAVLTSSALRLSLLAPRGPLVRVLLWTCSAAALMILGYDTEHTWLALPTSVSWQLGVVSGFSSLQAAVQQGAATDERLAVRLRP